MRKVKFFLFTLCILLLLTPGFLTAKSILDKPEQGLYFGYFTNPNDYNMRVRLYKESSTDTSVFFLKKYVPIYNIYSPTLVMNKANVWGHSAITKELTLGKYWTEIKAFDDEGKITGQAKRDFELTQEIIDILPGPWLIELTISEEENSPVDGEENGEN